MVKKGVALLILILILMLASACWDMFDIEDRVYISGIAFDMPDEEEVQRQRESLQEPDKFTPRYLITYVNPLPLAQVEGSSGESFSVRSITTVTPDEADRLMATRLNKRLYFGHTKIVLFGEELLKHENLLKETKDYLHRNQEFNWNILVGVVQGGKAKDAFDIKPQGVNHLVEYITGIMGNRAQSSRVADVTLTQLASDMGDDGTMALPKVIVAPDEVKVEGAAVIKDFKLIGYLSGVEGRSVMFLKGTLEGGSVVVKFKNEYIPYIIDNADVKNDLKIIEERIQLTYEIEAEGHLDEAIYGGDLVTDENIKAIEKQVEKEIIGDCLRIIEKLQEDMKVDVIYADSYIRKYHPRIWEQIKDDYMEYFEEMDIRVTADVKLRRAGVVK